VGHAAERMPPHASRYLVPAMAALFPKHAWIIAEGRYVMHHDTLVVWMLGIDQEPRRRCLDFKIELNAGVHWSIQSFGPEFSKETRIRG